MDTSDEYTNQLIQEFDVLAGKRGIWEKHWEEVALKVLPYYSTSFYAQGNMTPGVKRNQEQYDITANTALWRFAAAMESMLTPANGKWHRLRCTNPDLMKIRDVQMWFDQVNDLMFRYRYAPSANFQANQHDGYVSIGAFGTSSLFIDALDPKYGRGLRYRHVHLGELFFRANHQGIIDSVFRRFKMTTRQIAQKWGKDKLPDTLQGKLNDGKGKDEEVMCLHIVTPNNDYEPGRFDMKGKRFKSCYIIKDTRTLMEEGGYDSFPYATARYLTAPGELYGRSPAMNVLPSINVLNEEKKTILKQGHRTVDPILLAHDDGVLDGFSLKPGAINRGGVNADGRAMVQALPVGNIAIGKELMDDERQAINDAFLVTLFQILVETPQMTATEVLERAREKGALLSPTMGRFQSESIGPMIHREFDLLMSQGLLPPIPQALIEARGEYLVDYDAPLNRAMRSEEAAGVMRVAQWAAEIAAQTQDPSALDWIDWDVVIPEVADINGAPFRFIRDAATVQQIRDGRSQQQAAQQVTDALPGMAQMMKAAAPQGTSAAPGQPGTGA